MLEKIKNLKNDELFFHKAGVIIGGVVGLLVGFIISDQADKQDFLIVEEPDGEEND